ncbi:MAG: TIGR00296 family protein [Candidatus Bathyarchaeia archaeon]
MSCELNLEEGKFLVELARKAVWEYLKSRKRIEAPENTPEKILQQCGVFVTINSIRNGEKELRGCIGYPYPTNPLVEAVIDSAISSATQDPRFYPLSLTELDKVVFEVSVLTPPELVKAEKPMDYPQKIKVGKDGLIVERGPFKGLLLPQVPIEWGWDEEEFLCQCCMKAGLPPDNWLLEDTKIYKFQAVIFEEETPKGEVRLKALGGK